MVFVDSKVNEMHIIVQIRNEIVCIDKSIFVLYDYESIFPFEHIGASYKINTQVKFMYTFFPNDCSFYLSWHIQTADNLQLIVVSDT